MCPPAGGRTRSASLPFLAVRLRPHARPSMETCCCSWSSAGWPWPMCWPIRRDRLLRCPVRRQRYRGGAVWLAGLVTPLLTQFANRLAASVFVTSMPPDRRRPWHSAAILARIVAGTVDAATRFGARVREGEVRVAQLSRESMPRCRWTSGWAETLLPSTTRAVARKRLRRDPADAGHHLLRFLYRRCGTGVVTDGGVARRGTALRPPSRRCRRRRRCMVLDECCRPCEAAAGLRGPRADGVVGVRGAGAGEERGEGCRSCFLLERETLSTADRTDHRQPCRVHSAVA